MRLGFEIEITEYQFTSFQNGVQAVVDLTQSNLFLIGKWLKNNYKWIVFYCSNTQLIR